MAASPSPLSEELLDTKGRQADEDRQMDSQVGPVFSRPQATQPQTGFLPLTVPLLQAAASGDPQDETYAQLTHLALRWETSAPHSSLSEEHPDERSVYAALAVH